MAKEKNNQTKVQTSEELQFNGKGGDNVNKV